ncbi:N-(5'-phosphoribosyl)anthranilate isomerase [Mesobacillus campisalis]|uniref:N-(5'-phosphoribosyl)anthranilate isomerase n=1 Tax=Mesobacillus campisalis TaxID=1408103 RepID=A0A0M2SXR4_9BACI|nr:phosphoribosylanthranilate isomerase [Mesobacillus campisalis]KKK37777.1 N-(5'-phosphoribosyl)anthranilate isomerase [Mesobacillus campisalis]
MKVKICGIKTAEAALHAAAAGADALGFVFAPSKRQITPGEAKAIIQELPEAVWKVGVFVNEPPEKVASIAELAGLTHIQLHGEESPGDYMKIGRPLIKAYSIRDKEDITIIDYETSDYVLLDSPPATYKGGNGMSFDWNVASGAKRGRNVILAGGLDPDNVQTAIDKVRPFMVDVSSGVETEGKKDLRKIGRFIEIAKAGEDEGI